MWKIVLTDLNYVPLGEVRNADAQQYTFGLKKVPTVSFSVRADHPFAKTLYDGNCYVKAYKNSSLEFFGPVVAVEEVVSHGSMSLVVNAAGVAWFLTKRLVGTGPNGLQFDSLQDRAYLAQQMIAVTEGMSPMGIASDPAWATSGSTTTYETGPYRPLGEAVNELANTLDGFDWEIKPTEPTAFSRSGKIGEFRASALLGTNRTEAIFEFGVGRHSIVSYRMQLSRDVQANNIYFPAEGNRAGLNVGDQDAINAFRQLDDTISVSITDPTMRLDLANEHLRIRKNPRRVITFEPHVVDRSMPGRVPEFITDYRIGDTIRGRAKTHDVARFDAEFRVYGATVTKDKNGMESVGLILVEEA